MENNNIEQEEKSGDAKKETYSMIDDANLAAKRMEEANKVKGELLDREEALEARKAVGGNAEAGEKQEPKEETPREYMEKVMSGGIN